MAEDIDNECAELHLVFLFSTHHLVFNLAWCWLCQRSSYPFWRVTLQCGRGNYLIFRGDMWMSFFFLLSFSPFSFFYFNRLKNILSSAWPLILWPNDHFLTFSGILVKSGSFLAFSTAGLGFNFLGSAESVPTCLYASSLLKFCWSPLLSYFPCSYKSRP